MKALKLVQEEIAGVLDGLDRGDVDKLLDSLATSGRRWFVSGQGRSRLVASMAAMRFMHLGFDVHLVGEVTTPSIGPGDGLLVLSASGETPVSVHLARRAHELGAEVVAVTGNQQSSLGSTANIIVTVPAAGSRQFGGSLFEQATLILLDALVFELTDGNPETYAAMSRRHTNLE